MYLESFEAEVAWGQIQGTRKTQQDHGAVVSWPNGFQLLILADGIGGHAGGQEASHTIVNAFRESFINDPIDDLQKKLLHGLEIANVKIFEFVKDRPELKGMGATLLAAVFDGCSVRWISVGDSPMWLYRNGKLKRLNENHSMAAVFEKRIAQGEMTAEEAAVSPERTQLLEAVLGKNIEQVDLPHEALDVQDGDIFLLASDGVESCPTTDLEELLTKKNQLAPDTVQDILKRVEQCQKPSQDNATVMALQISIPQAEIDTVQ